MDGQPDGEIVVPCTQHILLLFYLLLCKACLKSILAYSITGFLLLTVCTVRRVFLTLAFTAW